MTDYTIPMIIGMTLAFALGAGLGGLWGLSRHEWLYCRVTAHLTWRMREAMKSLGIQEWQIDKALEYMGSVTIPPHIPMPEPQVKGEANVSRLNRRSSRGATSTGSRTRWTRWCADCHRTATGQASGTAPAGSAGWRGASTWWTQRA